MRGVWVVMVVVMVTSALGQESSRHRNAAKPKKKHKCKYFWEGVEGPCDPDTLTQSISFPLKKGVNCPPFRNFSQPCRHDDRGDGGGGDGDHGLDLLDHRSFKGCKYDRPGGQWTECGPGILTRNKVMTLLPGQPPSCPPTKTKTTPCKNKKSGKDKKARKKAAKKAKKKAKKAKRKGKGKGCKYQKEQWSECDPSTNLRQRELILRKGDSSVCLPKKVITKKCNKPCKYIKGPWSQCDHMTKEKIRMLTLKKGDPSVCNATSIVKPCKQRGHFRAAEISQCHYKPQGGWGACEDRTNTMKRVLVLKAGDPQLCSPTKELSAKCKKQCKFAKGAWSECDESSGLRTRTDHLVKGEAAHCEATRTISRKCGKGNGCKYDVGDWGECEEGSQQRSRFKTLVSGDPDKCQPQLTITRPCFRPDGQENCFLGPWGDYGPCQNGVMTKHREIIAGGVQCTRKAVKSRPC